MRGISPLRYLSIAIFCKCVIIVCSKSRDEQESRLYRCQQRSTSGRDYMGETNTTVDRILCQRWSETQPHNHPFTHVGDHNFCRNPDGDTNGVWCLTTDPEVWFQYCSVPFCPTLRALDFSLDNDD